MKVIVSSVNIDWGWIYRVDPMKYLKYAYYYCLGWYFTIIH